MNTMFTDKLRFKDLEETLVNSTPLLAVVGAGDLAVEKLRAAREELVTRSASFDPKSFRDQAQATFAERVGALQNEVQAAPDQLKAFPERAQEWPAKAQALFADVIATAFTAYGDLAGRGKTVVTSLRGDQSVAETVAPVTRPTTAKSTSTSTGTASKSSKSSGSTSKASGSTSKTPSSASKSSSSAGTSTAKPAAKKTSTRTTKKAPATKKSSSSSSSN